MSIRLMTAIWDSEQYEQTTLLVLLALADQANDAGECWPAVTTIAKRARCSVRHCRTILTKLESEGALTIRHRAGTSSMYRVAAEHFEPTPKLSTTPEPRIRGEISSGVNSRSGGSGSPDQGGPDLEITQIVREPSMKQRGASQQPSAASDQSKTNHSPTISDTTTLANPKRCAAHQQTDSPPPCIACRDARIAAESAGDDAARADRVRRDMLDRHPPVEPPSWLADYGSRIFQAWNREVRARIVAGETVTARVSEQIARRVTEQGGMTA